jgi:hypothetical protein
MLKSSVANSGFGMAGRTEMGAAVITGDCEKLVFLLSKAQP